MEPIVEVKNLKKSYKKRRTNEYVHAVSDISFKVYPGEILGLLGPNGTCTYRRTYKKGRKTKPYVHTTWFNASCV